MIKTPVFWVMYVMFVLMGAGGLMVTAQLALMAKDLKVADVPIDLGFWVPTALVLALSLDRILNGLTRPFFGWVSDHIGRENTMFIAFGLEGIGIFALDTSSRSRCTSLRAARSSGSASTTIPRRTNGTRRRKRKCTGPSRAGTRCTSRSRSTRSTARC
jgi:MFS family permease